MDEGYRIHVRLRPWRALAVFMDGSHSAFRHHHVYHDDGQLRIPNLQPNLPLPALGYYDRVRNLGIFFAFYPGTLCVGQLSVGQLYLCAAPYIRALS